jgi:hypothetical protein
MARYIFGLLLAVGLIVVVIILIVRGFSSGPQGPKALDLNSYASSDASVQFTIDSPVTASADHRDIIITVNNTTTTIRVTKGYEGETVRTNTYPMNVSAFAVFLHALTLNGFTKGDSSPELADERGQCALGDRFMYQVIDGNGKNLERYWHTSCDSGTFKGNALTIRRLFVAQVPDYDDQTTDVSL